MENQIATQDAKETAKENPTRKYVVVNDQHDEGKFVLGIYDDELTAVGMMMTSIWDFKDSYKKDGDSFEISDPYYLGGEGADSGIGIKVTFKAACWKKAEEEHYYVLFA